MKKFVAAAFALLSGVVLLIPDFIPLLDEAVALAVFVASMKALGINVTSWIPFLRKRHEAKGPPSRVVDV